MEAETWTSQSGTKIKKLGVRRLRAIEFVELMVNKYGTKIRTVLADADIFNIILEWFTEYPQHDIMLQKLTSIFG